MKRVAFLLFVGCIVFNSALNCYGQLYTAPNIFRLWNQPEEAHRTTFLKDGFNKVYGGPKKEGGYLYLYHQKKAKEYLFINYDEKYRITLINYYLLNKKAYLNLIANRSNLEDGEKMSPQGLTIYEDGKKYYQMIFTKTLR